MVAVSIENNNSLVPSFDLALRSLPPPGPQFQGRPEKPRKIWSHAFAVKAGRRLAYGFPYLYINPMQPEKCWVPFCIVLLNVSEPKWLFCYKRCNHYINT